MHAVQSHDNMQSTSLVNDDQGQHIVPPWTQMTKAHEKKWSCPIPLCSKHLHLGACTEELPSTCSTVYISQYQGVDIFRMQIWPAWAMSSVDAAFANLVSTAFASAIGPPLVPSGNSHSWRVMACPINNPEQQNRHYVGCFLEGATGSSLAAWAVASGCIGQVMCASPSIVASCWHGDYCLVV